MTRNDRAQILAALCLLLALRAPNAWGQRHKAVQPGIPAYTAADPYFPSSGVPFGDATQITVTLQAGAEASIRTAGDTVQLPIWRVRGNRYCLTQVIGVAVGGTATATFDAAEYQSGDWIVIEDGPWTVTLLHASGMIDGMGPPWKVMKSEHWVGYHNNCGGLK